MVIYVYCKSNTFFWKNWAKWWQYFICFNIRDEPYIYESIRFGFPWNSDDAIFINYCMLYTKHYIYVEKLIENRNHNGLNIDFFEYLSHLKYILKIEKGIHKNQSTKFDHFNVIYSIIYKMYAC